MYPIIPKRKLSLGLSAILIIASLTCIAVWGLRFGIDFTGGTLIELHNEDAAQPIATNDLRASLTAGGIHVVSLQTTDTRSYLLRTQAMDEGEHQRFSLLLIEKYPVAEGGSSRLTELRYESVGPTIGAEFRQKAFLTIGIALVAIILYIAYSFRKVSYPLASWKYGVCAVIALAHDITIPTGIYAALGYFYGWEVDLLFVTALLTILGFSVHDTIVVFDRIRENLIKSGGKNFDDVANDSVNQTLARSINTSLTTLLVLVALFIFGGDTTKHFTFVLILGIIFGTYSSIFVASPLLVIWNNYNNHLRSK